ncbi:MAG: hypothetical protein PXY39_12365 [archaeon]|nr:hypothetical protein [archaeon]
MKLKRSNTRVSLGPQDFAERSKRILGEKQNVFLLSLAILSFGAVVSLAALGEGRLTVYLSVLTIAYFASTLIFRVKRRPSFDFLAVALVIVFAVSIISTLI